MRRLAVVLLPALLAACSSGLPEAPRNLTLGYDGRGTLDLPVPDGTIWQIQGPQELRVDPARGIGPAVLALEAPLERAPNLPAERFTLTWQGDLQGTLTVRWPLVRVEGREDRGDAGAAGPGDDRPRGPARAAAGRPQRGLGRARRRGPGPGRTR